MALGILEELEKKNVIRTFTEKDHNSAEYLHAIIEALRIAFADGPGSSQIQTSSKYPLRNSFPVLTLPREQNFSIPRKRQTESLMEVQPTSQVTQSTSQLQTRRAMDVLSSIAITVVSAPVSCPKDVALRYRIVEQTSLSTNIIPMSLLRGRGLIIRLFRLWSRILMMVAYTPCMASWAALCNHKDTCRSY